jgi:tripartite ATP-independent transporter DctP family solute receptor
MSAVFKSEVESKSDGQIKVEIYPDGEIGKEVETLIQVKSGKVQSFISTSGAIAQFYPLIDVTNIPFAFSSYNVAYNVYDGQFGKELAADIEEKAGFHVLGFGESGGFFAITNSKRPIRSPGDLKGLRLRTMPIPLHQEIVRALGATPISIAWSELYKSLLAGVVDGQMNPVSIIVMDRLYEVQRYVTLLDLIYSPYVWVINLEFYNSLSKELRIIVDDAAKTAILAGRGLSRIIDSTERGLPTLSKKMQVYVPSRAVIKQFQDIMVPAAQKFLLTQYKEEGRIWMDKFFAAIDKAEKELEY